jgi:hypothetical protein
MRSLNLFFQVFGGLHNGEDKTMKITPRHFFAILLFIIIPLSSFAQPKKVADIPAPQGYKRLSYPSGSYSSWITELPLLSATVVHTYKGDAIPDNYYRVFAVVDMPLLFKQDLEQCADFAFRFRAEYYKRRNQLDKLSLFKYDGSNLTFKSTGKSFTQFLKSCMANANSHSIKKGCGTVDIAQAKPGDMIVQNENGGIGHVSIVMDACESEKGVRLYLIGFSFMPGQQFHIEKADSRFGKEGWFSFEGFYHYLDESLGLGTPVLKRFNEE